MSGHQHDASSGNLRVAFFLNAAFTLIEVASAAMAASMRSATLRDRRKGILGAVEEALRSEFVRAIPETRVAPTGTPAHSQMVPPSSSRASSYSTISGRCAHRCV